MVVMAFVLQFPDLRRIQGELAYKLDMKFEETLHERADRLYQRMMEEKSILIILEFLHIYRLDNVKKNMRQHQLPRDSFCKQSEVTVTRFEEVY